MSTLAELKAEIGAVWCPRCKEETLPHDSKGTCLFCDTKLIDGEGKTLHTAPANSSSGRDALDRMDAGQPQAGQPPAATTQACKTPGCQNQANTRYDRGPFARLCTETCIPIAREGISARSKAAKAARATPPSPAKQQARTKPKAVPAPTVPNDPGGASSSLAELAATYEEAIAAHARTAEQLEAARTRISEHPLFADLTAKAA